MSKTQGITAYPLAWPDGWPRTSADKRVTSRFKATLAGAINNVETSLSLFSRESGRKLSSVIISSNYSLMDRNPRDSGVAVYFTWDDISTCIAVDRYPKLEDNLQAIHHVIEAERTKLRHGGLNIVRAAFRGYAALPPPSARRPWREVLHFRGDVGVTIEVAEQRYHDLAKKAHPDCGGSDEAMAELNAAMADARGELS